ncbi:hypothetical protein TNCV_34171 [Trichonephila clavipes]|nr:hypothetical protein TNCV_34171 [Trichonephila clavipes]
MSFDYAETMIPDGYGSEESQEFDLKLTISLKDIAVVMLVSWSVQGRLSRSELISKSSTQFNHCIYLSG